MRALNELKEERIRLEGIRKTIYQRKYVRSKPEITRGVACGNLHDAAGLHKGEVDEACGDVCYVSEKA